MSFGLRNIFEVLAIGSLIILALILLLLFYLKPFRVDRSVPGPKRTPFVGVLFNEASEIFSEGFGWDQWPSLSLVLSRRFKFQTWGGPTLNLGFGGAMFNIVSPDCLQYVLKDNFNNYEKGNLSKSLLELFGKVAFTTDGDEWKFHRRLAVSFLNKEASNYSCAILVRKLKELVPFLDDKVKFQETFDLQSLFRQLTMDVFLELGFGLDMINIGETDIHIFSNALDELQSLIHDRFVDLLWEVKQRFVLGDREKRIKKCSGIIYDFSNRVIEEAKVKSTGRLDLVSRYLHYHRESAKLDPSNKELINFIISMIIGGRDTTSAGITWTFYELSKNPTVVQKVREELDEFLITKDSFPIDTIHKLKYTLAVVMEALRLHPPAPESFRFSKNDDILPDGTKIPAKSLVMFSINSINNSDQVWDDPSTFNPDRFFNHKNPSVFHLPTFSGGPRKCPGQSLVLKEIVICVAFLVSRYDFIDIERHDGSFKWALVMSMKNGFQVNVKTYSKKV